MRDRRFGGLEWDDGSLGWEDEDLGGKMKNLSFYELKNFEIVHVCAVDQFVEVGGIQEFEYLSPSLESHLLRIGR